MGNFLELTLVVGLLCGGAGAEETLHTFHEPSAPIPPDTVGTSSDFPTPLVSPEDSRPNPAARGNSAEATPAAHHVRFQPARRADHVFRHGPTSGSRRFDAPLYAPYTAWEIRPGDNRVLGNGQVMLPLWQTDDSLLFADLRGQTDDSQNREGNWGLGLRQMLNNDMIVGGYGFYDLRRTEFDNEFDQLTFGLEALTVQWEARVNGYVAESGAKAVDGRPGAAAFRNGTIVLLGTTERAYSGFDAEIGGLLREWYGGDLELRGFIGGFHFDNDATGFRHVSGPRARLELRAYDLAWLGDQSRVTLGAEWQWDQVRDDQVFAMLRVRIPLGGGGDRRRPTRLERRMLDRVVRDVDVVTEAPPTAQESALYADTGQLVGPVTLVDANTPNPSGTVAGAGAGGTVIVDGAQGGIQTDTPIVLQDGQTVRGAGFDVVGRVTGARSTFGTRPTVNGSDPNENVFEIADNSVLRDLNVTGGDNGVYADNVSGFRISGLHISGADASGVYFESNMTGFTLTGNTAANNGENGFDFLDLTGGTVTGNTATNNGEDGFDFRDIYGGTIAGNTATGNDGDELNFRDVEGGTITGNTGTDNGVFGLHFDDIRGGAIAGNTATNNGDDGFNFEDISGGAITGNTSTNNNGAGFRIEDFLVGNTATFTDNEATDNGGSGYSIDSGAPATGGNNTGSGNLDTNTGP